VAESLELQLLDTSFAIRCHAVEWKGFLAQLWAPFVASATVKGAQEVEIMAHREGWTMEFFGEWAAQDRDPWALGNELRNAMFQRALEGFDDDGIVIHAAALAKDGLGMLLCGPAGVGKSSLTLALLNRGWAYLSDDFAPVLVASREVLPVPKPIHCKDPDAWKGLLTRWHPPEWIPAPVRSCLVPATLFPVMESPIAVRLIAFPRFDPTSQSSSSRLTVAEAAARCAVNLHGLSRLDPLALRTVAEVAEEASSCEMTYSSTTHALALIDELVAGASGIG
jgi:hypothetical protein